LWPPRALLFVSDAVIGPILSGILLVTRLIIKYMRFKDVRLPKIDLSPFQ
jgi:hypothetical protein